MNGLHRHSEGIKRSRVVLTGIAATLLVGVMMLARPEAAAQSKETVAPKAASAPAGKAENGKIIYMKLGCWECHGRDAQSGRPTLGPAALPFAAFMNQVRKPREDMPPYTTKVLSDAEIADIYAWVLTRPVPPKVESVPLLQ